MKPDQITEAIEVERAQIAAEVHDALLPLIFAASATLQQHLDTLSSGGPLSSGDPVDQSQLQRLNQASNWLQEALQAGRRILSQAHRPEIVGDNWVRAAQDTLSQFDGDAGALIAWDVQVDVAAFTNTAAIACYRIVVEAARNAIRHAQADNVTIRVTTESESRILITIDDNGIGFDPRDVPSDRFGLRSMQVRAELIGGQLTVESSAGQGTVVRLTLPQGS